MPTVPVMDRRERFRAYMRGFNPTAPARTSIEAGLIVEDPKRSAYANLAARADLEPSSQQLIAGGIGSGKTTELLLADKWLSEKGHHLPVYIDVTAETDLSKLNEGALLASLGLHLAVFLDDHQDSKVRAARKQARGFAYGTVEWVEGYPDDDELQLPPIDYEDGWEPPPPPPGYVVRIPGKLFPPMPPLRRDITEIAQPLTALVNAIREKGKEVVAIWDGLDRLMAPEKFWSLVAQDFRALRNSGVGVLAAAPLSVLYGRGREISAYFDRVRHLPTAMADPQRSGFLQEVLQRRGARDLLQERDIHSLCVGSGGVLRDLVTLARNAGESAYIAGKDGITAEDVAKAIQELGHSYFLGLGASQLKILTKLRDHGSFSLDEPGSMELLLTRRVLEYEGPPPRYDVHPALLTLLPPQEAK